AAARVGSPKPPVAPSPVRVPEKRMSPVDKAQARVAALKKKASSSRLKAARLREEERAAKRALLRRRREEERALEVQPMESFTDPIPAEYLAPAPEESADDAAIDWQ